MTPASWIQEVDVVERQLTSFLPLPGEFFIFAPAAVHKMAILSTVEAALSCIRFLSFAEVWRVRRSCMSFSAVARRDESCGSGTLDTALHRLAGVSEQRAMLRASSFLKSLARPCRNKDEQLPRLLGLAG